MFKTLAIALVTVGSLAAATAAQAGGDFNSGHGYGQGYGYGHGYGHGYVQVYTPPVYYPTCEKILTYDHYGNAYWVKSCH